MARILGVLLVLLTLIGVDRTARAQESLEVKLIEDAIATVQAMKETSASEFERLWRRTKAVVIVPHLARGGWIIGGEFGSGVLLVRRTDAAEWSDPVFYTLASGSIGFQFGADLSQLMLVVTADTALEKLLTGRVRLGADVGFAVGPVGRGAQVGRVVDDERADIFALSIARGGLFGGFAMKGGALLPNNAANSGFYGEGVAPAELVARAPGGNDGTVRLRAALSGFLDGLELAPLQVARTGAVQPNASKTKKRRKENATAAGALAEERKPAAPAVVTTPAFFTSASLSTADLEGTRRTPVENPPLSSREGWIVDTLRRNDLR